MPRSVLRRAGHAVMLVVPLLNNQRRAILELALVVAFTEATSDLPARRRAVVVIDAAQWIPHWNQSMKPGQIVKLRKQLD